MAAIRLEHIYKRYSPTVTAVKDFNLDIQDQEFIVFVGPSGCGKSTTLRMIAGLEEITEGDFFLGNKRVNDLPPKDRDIAMVFQNYALYPHLTVFENMAFGLKLRKYKKEEIQKRVQEAANILDIVHLLDRRPKELSGGQRQRVALGRAIVREPQVFLMDEPLSNLDAKLRVQMRTEISKLHKRLQTTMIYVTHDQIEAMTMADRLVVMKDGLIQQIGTPKEVYNDPANVFVGSFIGSPPMNFISAKLVDNSVRWGKQALPLTGEQQQLLQAYQGRDVLVGLRPEHLATHSQAFPQAAALHTVLEVSELLGSEVYLHVQSEEVRLVAKVEPVEKPLLVEHPLTLYANMEKLHFFDPETELRIG